MKENTSKTRRKKENENGNEIKPSRGWVSAGKNIIKKKNPHRQEFFLMLWANIFIVFRFIFSRYFSILHAAFHCPSSSLHPGQWCIFSQTAQLPQPPLRDNATTRNKNRLLRKKATSILFSVVGEVELFSTRIVKIFGRKNSFIFSTFR